MQVPLRITDEEIEAALSAADFVASCDQAFQLYGKGEMQNPPREETLEKVGDLDLFRLVLPGQWPGRYRGRKVIEERSDVKTGRLGERTAVIELEDLVTGKRVVLDAEYITNMRTGAAGVLGVKYLGRRDVQTVAILGTGRIARALALCADGALSPREIRATSRTAPKRAAFETEVAPQVRCALRMTESIGACVDGADAVLAAVPTPEPILKAGDLGEEVHLSVMGGDARTRQIDPALFASRTVVADHSGQAGKSGDFLGLEGREIAWAMDPKGGVQTIGDAALGRLEDRRGTGAIAYFTGMAIQDLHAASKAVEAITG